MPNARASPVRMETVFEEPAVLGFLDDGGQDINKIVNKEHGRTTLQRAGWAFNVLVMALHFGLALGLIVKGNIADFGLDVYGLYLGATLAVLVIFFYGLFLYQPTRPVVRGSDIGVHAIGVLFNGVCMTVLWIKFADGPVVGALMLTLLLGIVWVGYLVHHVRTTNARVVPVEANV